MCVFGQSLQLKRLGGHRQPTLIAPPLPPAPSLRPQPTHPRLLRTDRWAPYAETRPRRTAQSTRPQIQVPGIQHANRRIRCLPHGHPSGTVADGNAANASSTAIGCSAGGRTTESSTEEAGGGWGCRSGSGSGGTTPASGSMGETRPGNRMQRGSMSPPSLASLDEVGEL
jgi:hypothetical protein